MANKNLKTGLYLVGAVILLILIISFIFQMNNWRDNRMKIKQEYEIYGRLDEVLAGHNETLEGHIAGNSRAVESLQVLLNHIAGNEAYHDSLAVHLQNGTSRDQINLDATYLEKIIGPEIGLTPGISTLLLKYIEQLGALRVFELQNVSPFYNNTIAPIKTANFIMSENSEALVPKNYELLRQDEDFASILQQLKALNEQSISLCTELLSTSKLISEEISDFRHGF